MTAARRLVASYYPASIDVFAAEAASLVIEHSAADRRIQGRYPCSTVSVSRGMNVEGVTVTVRKIVQ